MARPILGRTCVTSSTRARAAIRYFARSGNTITGAETIAQSTLRDDILASGRDDWVSLADVRGQISRRGLVHSAPKRQALILQTVWSLPEEDLVEVGNIPAPTNSGFLVWPGTIKEVMKRLTKRVVVRYDDPDPWEYPTWLNRTADGELASADVVRTRSANR